jgi:hypothetical protein
MNRTGRLRLELIDVYGQRLSERADIFLRHHELSVVAAARSVDATKRIEIKDLRGVPRGLYRLFIDPPSYLPAAAFVNIHASDVTDRVFTFAVDPEKVIRVDFPDYSTISFAHSLLDASKQVLGFSALAGEALYSALDDIRRAGLLNIVAKCRRTSVPGGGPVLDHIREIMEIRGDRFFAAVSRDLREHVKNSVGGGTFFPVSGALHRPPDGFSEAGSFKTPERYGNLQLTFFASGEVWLADIDIDDAGGLEHLFQVVRNTLTGRPTHPFDIQQILLKEQEIDPGYRLVLHEATARLGRAAGQKG